jgi:hypothetical protein
MADYVPTWIEIGGPIPRRLVPELINCIISESLRDNFGGQRIAAANAEDLLSDAKDAQGNPDTLKLYEESAKNGQFDQLEQFLEEHGIEFDRHCGGGAEFSPELTRFRRGWSAPTVTLLDAIGREVILTEYIVEALQMLRAEKPAEAIAHLAALAGEGTPALEPLSLCD